jgi:hypothetical protein
MWIALVMTGWALAVGAFLLHMKPMWKEDRKMRTRRAKYARD